MSKKRDDDESVTVYISNYRQAETHYNMQEAVDYGAFGKFFNLPTIIEISSADDYQVVRSNLDTLYSFGVFNLTTALSITLPASNGYYMSLLVLDEEQYVLGVVYPDDSSEKSIKIAYSNRSLNSTDKLILSTTKLIYILIRTLANPNDADDMKRAHLLQYGVEVSQSDIGEFVIPDWDLTSLADVRSGVSSLQSYIEQGSEVNGYRGVIDPTYELIGTAVGWGGLPQEDAVYQAFYPDDDEDDLVYYIYVEANSVPIASDAFWSITVYNASNYLQYNDMGSYSLNSLTATPADDGSYTIYFSSLDKKTDSMTNWIWTYPGWSYLVRLYEPDEQILNGTWTFPGLNLVS